MQLVNFFCKSRSDFAPTIEGIDLQSVNLIVGRNGSGKSYALRRIEEFTDIISEKNAHPVVRDWRATFVDAEKNILDYSFGWNDNGFSINYEKLEYNGTLLIDRKENICKIFSKLLLNFETIFPPEAKLVIHVRRDVQVHPEFEKLINWADTSYSFRFATIISHIDNVNSKLSKLNFSPLIVGENETLLADLVEKLSPQSRLEVVNLMKQFGYAIEKVETKGLKEERNVFVSENGIPHSFNASVLSQGTFRTFILLTYFLFSIYNKKPQLILIDDLGEGLDYSRAYKLGKFIFDKCQETGIQLIATSNDSFLMDAIPIEYWNVLRRNGIEITAFNEKNNPELFENFAYTGLSNFDFFSSDYIDSKLK